MHVVVIALVLASTPVASESESSPPRILGPALGALIGGTAGAVICAAGAAVVEPSENAPFAMIAICSLAIPTTLLGAMAGAVVSGSDEGSAALGGSAGMLAGV